MGFIQIHYTAYKGWYVCAETDDQNRCVEVGAKTWLGP